MRGITLSGNTVVPRNVSYVPANTPLIYPMDPRVSNAGISFLGLVMGNETFTPDYRTAIEGIIPFFNSLQRNRKYTRLYQTFQSLMLDTYGLVYMTENGSPNVRDFSLVDINRVHQNIKSLVNTLRSDEFADVGPVVLSLNELDNNLMYTFSTFSDLDYSITSTYDNEKGRINLLPNSDFSQFNTFYQAPSNENFITDADSSTLIYTGSEQEVLVSAYPIPVNEGELMSLRADSNNPITVTAVDLLGKQVAYVNSAGYTISSGLIGTTQGGDTQQLQAFSIPNGVDFISLSFSLHKATNVGDDRMSQIMLTRGSTTGNYVKGAINDDL